MRKSLILLASALLIAVGAAGTHRLRYDTTVFTGRGELTQTRPRVVREYPPCIKGEREDRCIQLYERGMRRAYARWLADHGVTPRDRHAAARAYPPCRSRSDDRCQQRSARRHARTGRATTPLRTARRGRQHTLARSRAAVVRRTAPQRCRCETARRANPSRRAAAPSRRPAAVTRTTTRAPARAVAPRAQQQPRPAPRRPNAPQQPPQQVNTPGI